MNERLPYEEELAKKWDDLVLPDENVSWDDMKRRLEEDNDDGVIIPPVQKGCLGYGLLFILLAVIIFMIAWPHKRQPVKEKNIISAADTLKTTDVGIKNPEKKFKNDNSSRTPIISIDSPGIDNKPHLTQGNSLKPVNKKEYRQNSNARKQIAINGYSNDSNNQIKETNSRKINARKISGKLESEISKNEINDDDAVEQKEDVSDSNPINTGKTPGSTKIEIQDSTNIKKKTKEIDSSGDRMKKDSVVRNKIYFAAGLAVHQQLPVNGQKLTPYNSLGRKSSLADYIPSVYFRMYKDQKWFIQSEFRYGAPQYTKEILYTQKKIIDTFSSTTMSTSNRLKKSFYHQLPVSFNYFIFPHFSFGLGFTWNKFSSAVIEQETKETNNITMIDSNKVTTILHPKKADSNFVKSYLQALVETQYEWKRFAFGARYSFGLQPYLKFQLPGGEQKEEKNNVLQIFIRYNLWESRKK